MRSCGDRDCRSPRPTLCQYVMRGRIEDCLNLTLLFGTLTVSNSSSLEIKSVFGSAATRLAKGSTAKKKMAAVVEKENFILPLTSSSVNIPQ